MLEILEDTPEIKNFLVDNIAKLENEKCFDHHINPINYEGSIPVDEKFDFIKKGFKNYYKKVYYNIILFKLKKEAQKMFRIKVIGKENVNKLKNKSAIITCNHFNKLDSFAVKSAFGNNIWTISGDYNNFKGFVGNIARNTGLLPLSEKLSVKKNFANGLKYHLTHKHKVLIYPERAMWWNYKKPRPLHIGAFHWAVQNNVPVVPTFVTFEDSGKKDKDGYAEYYWTINVLEPIFPNQNLPPKERMEDMRQKNYNAWKVCYEKTYNKKLEY